MKAKSIKILFVLVFLVALTSRSQGPVIPDTDFGVTGQRMFMIDSYPLSYGNDVKVLGDGKILMSGVYRPGSNGVSFRIVLLKFNQNGTVDTSFGTQGVATGFMGTANSIGGIRNRILVQNDGKIYVTGYGYTLSNDMVVCRFYPDGTVDSTFNGTGTLFIDNQGTNNMLDQLHGITQDAAGFLYTTGTSATNTGFPPPTGIPVAKFDMSGVFQADFAGDGTQVYTPASYRGAAHDIAIQANGKIVLGGYAGLPAALLVMRLNADGSYDSTFNGTGKKFVDVSGIGIANDGYSMILQSDGKIVLSGAGFEGGTGKYVGSVIRLNNDGTLDNTFGGGDGITLLNPTGSYLSCILNKIIQMPDGRYLTGGQMKNPGNYDFVLMRLNADGSQDTAFNNIGYFTHDFSGLNVDDYCYGIDIQSDGKIIMSGNTEIGGGVQNRFSIIRLIPDAVISAFTPSTAQLLCQGESIVYSSQSQGNNLTHNWIFGGGTPASSTLTNPEVTYNTSGVYSTSLIVSNGTMTDTLTYTDYITVLAPPQTPGNISGATQVCGSTTTEYSISAVPSAESYTWQQEPYNAGIITSNGTSAIFVSSSEYIGSFTISVSASNNCGTSANSTLNGQISEAPTIFVLTGPGYYCEGTTGQTFTLSGSELTSTYELLLNNTPTGNIIQGTGNSIMWTNILTEGFYTVRAMNGCMLTMAGQIYNTMYLMPQAPGKPSGETSVCNTETTVYSVAAVSGALSYTWQLNPTSAGTLTINGTQAEVAWNPTFEGTAKLAVSATNECGTSPQSPELIIEVSAIPAPVISGLDFMCVDQSSAYFAANNPNSIYNWAVTGGVITSGAGSNYIVINWNTVGTASIQLTEISSQGCSGDAIQFSVEVSLCTDIEAEKQLDAFSVFPNPVTDVMQIHLPVAVAVNNIQVYGATGSLVYEDHEPKTSNGEYSINMNGLKSGSYALKVLTQNKLVYKTIFIKK